jgi:hypothetical protein
MSQTLHIFRKDIRHHWPEVLVSLLLLAAFVWHERAEWSGNFPSFSLLQILFSFVNTLLPLSWCLMIVRVVHEESLVGDRQFWVTRPYEWPSLLAAKLLFLIVFIHLPVFVAQLLLLRRAGFPIAPNLAGLLGMQIGLGLLFLAPITLAVVTRSLAQALIVAIAAFLVFLSVGSLASLVPNETMSSALENSGIFQGSVLLAAPVAAILWQYARRRTWHSRALLLAAGAAMFLADLVTPYRTLIERQYPLVDSGHPAPVQLSVIPPPPPVKKAPSPQGPLGNTVLISIPVHVSAVARHSVVLANGMLVSMDGPRNLKWDSGWNPSGTEFWPEESSSALQFSMKRDLYESIRSSPLHLHLSLALSEFNESLPRELSLPEGDFVVPGVGYCHSERGYFPALRCRSALHEPALIASGVVTNASCSEQDKVPSAPSRNVAHQLLRSGHGGFVNPGVSPIKTFSIYLQTFDDTHQSPEERARMHFCPGTPVRFATPIRSGYTRLDLQTDQITLEDYELNPYGYGGITLRALP